METDDGESFFMGSKRSKILVIDDDQDIIDVLKEFLRDDIKNSVVTAVTSGVEAVKAYEKETPDLIITDMEMPGLTGLDLIKRIKGSGLQIPVIVLTGVPQGETLKEAWFEGFDEYLEKPIDRKQLAETVQRLLTTKTHAS